MLTLAKPSSKTIRLFLEDQAAAPLSDPAIEGLKHWPPPGYDREVFRVALGTGEACLKRAIEAIRGWRMFPVAMCELCFPNCPIERNANVAVLIRGPGFWSLNPCRILEVMDERSGETRSPVKARFGFIYGTLPGHLEHGAERFLVEWRDDDSVWYEIDLFSRSQSWLAWLGYPIVRREQTRFRRLSGAAMQEAVR